MSEQSMPLNRVPLRPAVARAVPARRDQRAAGAPPLNPIAAGDNQPWNRIGQILVRNGVISDSILQRALERQTAENGAASRRLGRILVEDFGIHQEEINRHLARYYGFEEVEPDIGKIEEAQVEEIRRIVVALGTPGKNKLMEMSIIPYGRDSRRPDTILLLTPDPSAPEVRRALSQLGIPHYELLYCARDTVLALYERVLPQDNEFLRHFREAAESNANVAVVSEQEDVSENQIEDEIHQSLLTDLIEGLLIEVVRKGASDLHVIPTGPDRTEFFFRIDGQLRFWHAQEGLRPESVSAVLKDRAQNIDRFEWDSAQDGFIQRLIDGHLIRYRVSVLPIISSEYRRRFESIVIRVLDDRKIITDLQKIGFQAQAYQDFYAAISRPQGIVILTGPTGSGKSTTLVAALYQVIRPEVNVLTIEDPVEYHIKGARQLKINLRMGFEQALRSILRHDPDVVMVGEIRDRETADMAIKLANTGHLTFSTLHTNDAPSAISRLYKMGVEPFLIAYAINIVVAQRLLRTLCRHCKQPVEANLDLARKLGFTDKQIQETTFYGPVGCPLCSNGFKGRVAIHEALTFTKRIRQLILQASHEIDEDAIRAEAIAHGMLTLRASGRERILDGLATLEEVALNTVDD